MSIHADQERAYYDAVYSRHRAAPDHALLVRRADMLRFLDDPSHNLYERRRLYGRVLQVLTAAPLEGVRVLDYGCGPAEWGVFLATEGARVTLLDLSAEAVALGLRRARANGVAQRVDGQARDAADLSCLRDGEFDLVFASAALHHTLKYPGAVEELVRVIRPAGRLVLAETLGNNPPLNALRRLRAWISREPAEQGEEILLGEPEIALLRSRFREVTVEPLNLLAMGKRLLRGRFHRGAARAVVHALESADRALLAAAPRLARYCGEAVIVAVK